LGKITLTRKAVYGFAALKLALFNLRTVCNWRLSNAGGCFIKAMRGYAILNPMTKLQIISNCMTKGCSKIFSRSLICAQR